MIQLTTKALEIASHLICKQPVIVVGPMGSGKFMAAAEAMKIVDAFPLLDIDMRHARRPPYSDITWEDVIAPQARFMIHIQNLLKKYPDRAVIYNNIDCAAPEYVMFMLEQMMFSERKTALVGDFRTLKELHNFMPGLDRCQIVEM